MADVRGIWEKVRHVPMGEKPDAATQAVIRSLSAPGSSLPEGSALLPSP